MNDSPAVHDRSPRGNEPFPTALRYPPTRTSDQFDDYHGTPVADPYRWLEDPDAPETVAWVEAQNTVTFDYLRGLPDRERFRTRLQTLSDYARMDPPLRRGDWYFIARNSGLLDQSILYKQHRLDGEAEILIDPNRLSDDGTTSLEIRSFSPDGTKLAYGISRGGSDWREIMVRDVETGEDHADLLRFVKFSQPAWTHDAAGFFYSRYPEPGQGLHVDVTRNQRLVYHRLGTDQADDRLIIERPEHPRWGYEPEVTDDGRYVVIRIWESTEEKSRIHWMDLGDPAAPRIDAPIEPLIDEFDADYILVGNDGPVLFFLTNLDAPRGKVIAVDVRRPERAAWRTVIPETDDTIERVRLVGDRFIVSRLHDVTSRIELYELDGRPAGVVELPTLGWVAAMTGRRSHPEAFLYFHSFLQAESVYRVDVATGSIAPIHVPELDVELESCVTEQVFYTGRDGTRIPMFVTHRRDVVLDGRNPTVVYGYGGFNHSITPHFKPWYAAWLELGGVLAVPSLRGGGEYGQDWHAAGTLERKQNTFDDCIAAAEHLVDQGYTTPAGLALLGRSNGGLLVGAVMTQRPDLFRVALPGVGVLDMLRYHLFTIGWAWAPDYGTADETTDFAYLHAYSPLHNLRPGTSYPATLITTADHDDRVVPAHSFKFAAALQAAQAGPHPVLIRVDVRAGHGAGKPTRMRIDEEADQLAFLRANLDWPDTSA